MDKGRLIEWIKEQKYSGKRFKEEEDEHTARLYRSLDRFCAYLREVCGLEYIGDTTLEALKGFTFIYPENDDEHLRLAFGYLGRDDLTQYLGTVSADKYFRNKKLSVALKSLDDLKAYIKDLRTADIRMASELLEAGATPEGRSAVSETTGVPEDVLLRMVHCCDLCRMTGMGGKTLARAVAMGYDTLERFRTTTPQLIEADFEEYLRATGEKSNRMVSFASFISQAHRLTDVVLS